MQVLEEAVAQTANPWPLRRERAVELAERYPHATEMLRLYTALIPIQEEAYLETREGRCPLCWGARAANPTSDDIAAVAVERVLPRIVDATVAFGPARLRDGVISAFATADLQRMIRQWLEGTSNSLNPFETYLARTSTSPLLEAMPRRSLQLAQPQSASSLRGSSGRGSVCPSCGGLPQLSYFALSGEALVTGPRYLVCSRCSNAWVFSRMTCASCGESEGGKLPIYQDSEQLKQIRVDGCRTCGKYLLTFDLRRDPKAVPIVDELAALPLDLYAKTQGLTKITPNLLGN